MYVNKEKIIIIIYILITICIVLGIGFLITGKIPEEIFKEKKEEKKEGYETQKTQYSKKTIEDDNINGERSYLIDTNQVDFNEKDMSVKTNYNMNNYNVQYHDDVVELKKETEQPFLGTFMAKDANNHLISVPYTPSLTLPTYYKPGSFIYGSSNYVPNYEDSVYLSRTTGLSSVGKAYESSEMAAGFCNYYANDKIKLEQICNQLSGNTCASVSCCVSLGGNKCVSGDEKGPTMKANYTDPSVINKDVYYYQGKCYGNCM